MGWALNPMTGVLKREDTQGRSPRDDRGRQTEVILPKASRIVGNHQKLEEERKDSSLGPSEGVTWPCGQLDFRDLASRNVRE